GTSRGMNATLGFGLWHPLHPVRARFKLKGGIHIGATDTGNNFLVTAMFSHILAEYFYLPAFLLGVFAVHTKQVTGKNGRFIAPGTGAHFKENVFVIIRIFGK